MVIATSVRPGFTCGRINVTRARSNASAAVGLRVAGKPSNIGLGSEEVRCMEQQQGQRNSHHALMGSISVAAEIGKHTEDVPSDLDINLDETEFAGLDAEAAAYSANASRMGFGEQKRTTEKGQETRRIAVVNLDWDHVKAAHLFKVFNSCATMMEDAVEEEAATGKTKRRKKKTAITARRYNRILRVTVYRSEFGKEKMAKEDMEGPPVEVYVEPKKKKNGKDILTDRRLALPDDDEDLANVDIEDINEKTIYHQEDAETYYALVEQDTPETLAYTANLLDFGFVSDEMDFDGEFWEELLDLAESNRGARLRRDEATQGLGNLEPLKFETDAWDDNDADQVEPTRRPPMAEEVETNDVKAYLANTSDSSEENEDQAPRNTRKEESFKERKQAERDRLRSLLLGAGGGGGGFFVIQKSRRPSTEEELALLSADIDNDNAGKHHFGTAKVIKAEKKKQSNFNKKGWNDEEAGSEDEAEHWRDFEIDVKGQRFWALHDKSEFAIDPSNPHFKEPKATSQLLDERRKRLKEEVKPEAEQRGAKRAAWEAAAGGNASLDFQKLIQSVKRRSGPKDAPHSELRRDRKKKFKSSS
ncbi:pre-rRNA-processing protein esf1 [Tulasnella sp. 408]|nr:pre-rRNA-processing protein esf1 [Tulasnella sp. 408]